MHPGISNLTRLKITHLSAPEFWGGAARAAFRLHQGLLRIGADSDFLVQYPTNEGKGVLQFRPRTSLYARMERRFKRYQLQQSRKAAFSRRPAGASLFTDDRSEYGSDALRQAAGSNIINLHWISGFFDYHSFFRDLQPQQQVVWTLHDMNPITGGCHHAGGCSRFHDVCGCCPQLASADPHDLSNEVWKRKQASYQSSGSNPICAVTPSHWLAGEVKKSSLMAKISVRVIPNGLDTESFQPRDKSAAREALGIPADARVVLFAAHSLDDRYKGFNVLIEALSKISHITGLYLLTLGRGKISETSPVAGKSLDLIHDEGVLPLVYSAADIYALPTFQDNFPNTTVESLACGTPVIASDVGGVSEIVRDNGTGLLVKAGEAEPLAAAISGLLADEGKRARLAAECRRVAVAEYSVDLQSARYAELYLSMLGGSVG
jgi:glycosyltransferase involved in cell wall biosynthesis